MSIYASGRPPKEDAAPEPMIYPDCNKPGPYRANLGHPLIRREYDEWRRRKGIPVWSVLTDDQRYEFDLLMIAKYYRIGGKEKDR